MTYPSILSACVMAVAVAFSSCARHEHHSEHDDDEHEHHHSGITLSPEKAAAAGVVVDTVRRGVFHGVIHTSGRVMSASCDETTVVATISGRVAYSDHVSEGMRIASGTKLFSITSAGMQAADGDPLEKARIDYEKQKLDYERSKQLVADRIISEKDFQAVKMSFETAELTYSSLLRNRSAGGMVVTAAKGGYVKQSLVKDGDYVEAGQPLLVITQNQHLYLRAEVPERHFNDLGKIMCAKFRTSYSDSLYDITDMGGRVQSYGRSADTNGSYIPVIFEFNNTGDVVQGSFADIYLITGRRDNVMTLPLTAISEEQGVHYVYVQDADDDDEYEKREVKMGFSDGDSIEILGGLNEGEKVVVKGVIQVKLAAASNAIPAHSHSH